jgi:hypothetical protein
MSRIGFAALVFEVAVGVAAQASGIGGIYVVIPAGVLAIATGVYIYLHLDSRPSLVECLRIFVAERRALSPPDTDEVANAEFEADTLECFRRRHAAEVSRCTQTLAQHGKIGAHEQRRLNNPQDLAGIDQLADRLAELGALSHY